ncbi:MAG: TldD/PmbA family protein [Asgard group archaeon]|nr:TldD/PmbA family protein [Asgard group archaeon]
MKQRQQGNNNIKGSEKQMEFHKELLIEKGALILNEAQKQEATQAEVVISMRTLALTRLANSIIDQNIAERHAKALITLYYGKKQGSINVEVFQDKDLRKAVADAAKIAKVSPANKDFESLPEPQPYKKPFSYKDLLCKSTINTTPEKRAEFAETAINTAHDVDKKIGTVAGAISNSLTEGVVMNSLGVEGYYVHAGCNINLTVLGKNGSEETAGWCTDSRRDINDLHIEKVAEIAAEKAAEGFGLKELGPGEYEVVLEPAAIGGILFMMNYYGFSSLMYQDYISFLRDKIGEKLFDKKLNITDNAYDTRHVYPTIFDDEGVPKQKLELVKNGVPKNLAYDTLRASKDDVESTGHNIKGRRGSFPVAVHPITEEGPASIDEMVAETKKGLLITHFHYQNAVNPTKGVFTGLTRDGTWYIENGEIQYPVKTLRYTDSVLRFLKNIDLIGKYGELNTTRGLIPAMKLPSFKFSGSTSG